VLEKNVICNTGIRIDYKSLLLNSILKKCGYIFHPKHFEILSVVKNNFLIFTIFSWDMMFYQERMIQSRNKVGVVAISGLYQHCCATPSFGP
jgi:hypothetical protein